MTSALNGWPLGDEHGPQHRVGVGLGDALGVQPVVHDAGPPLGRPGALPVIFWAQSGRSTVGREPHRHLDALGAVDEPTADRRGSRTCRRREHRFAGDLLDPVDPVEPLWSLEICASSWPPP
jgi:hypothetical protein